MEWMGAADGGKGMGMLVSVGRGGFSSVQDFRGETWGLFCNFKGFVRGFL